MPSPAADGLTPPTSALTPTSSLAIPRSSDGLARRRLWRTFRRNRPAVVGLVLVVAITGLALLAPLLPAHDPLEQNARARLRSPDSTHLLGRDGFGRDVLARVLHAGRISLLVGLCSVVVGAALGSGLGLVAGYGGPTTENVLMRLVDVLMAFPNLLLGLTILAVLGPGLLKMTIAIGLMLSPAFARVVHASVLSLKKREFVEAARALGVPQLRVLGFHVLPNVVGEVVVLASLWTASAIRVEASLSFIGLGVSPPTPTWGNMIREGTLHLTNAPWLSVVPGIAILVTVLGFNL